jgi:hypothetical protein
MILLVTFAAATSACSASDASDIAPEPASDEASASEGSSQDPSVDEPDERAESDEAAAGQDPESDVPFDSGDGWFEIDGERHKAEWVVRCMPQDVDMDQAHENDLELIAYAGGQTFLWLELSSQEVVLTPDDDRNYTALYAHPSLSRDGEGGREEFGDAGFATGPDGAWYDLRGASPMQLALGSEDSSPLPEPAATVQGERVTGTAADLTQEWPDEGTATVTVTYDLSIPAEEFDCEEL